jgi:hypothetical protein
MVRDAAVLARIQAIQEGGDREAAIRWWAVVV